MDIIVNHHTQTPIYLQIVNQLKEMILKGEITDGFRIAIREIPGETSERSSKHHYHKAYMELKAEDFIASSQGKGYRGLLSKRFRGKRREQQGDLMAEPH